MNTEVLGLAINDVRKRIEGRNVARLIAGFIVAAIIFAPVFMFIEPPVNGRFPTGTGALLVTWLGIAVLSGHAVAGALFACKTEELRLTLEMADAIMAISKALDTEKIETGNVEKKPANRDDGAVE